MNNLNIFANSTINGGEYNKVKIFGNTDVQGDLYANKMDIFGNADFNAYSEIKLVNVYGNADFNNHVKIDELNVKGACSFKDETSIKKISVYGSTSFSDKVFKFEEVNIYGNLDAKVLEADKIYVKGVLDCTEQLNADLIEFSSNGAGNIKEMVGSKVIIKPKTGIFTFKKSEHVINIDLIEADDIEIENVTAKMVRGNNVKIGKNCNIEEIEYSKDLQVDKSSHVGKSNQF